MPKGRAYQNDYYYYYAVVIRVEQKGGSRVG
jgi:hypothetical protein